MIDATQRVQTKTCDDPPPQRRVKGKRFIAEFVREAIEVVRTDWRAARFLPTAVVLVVIASLIIAGCYVNHPQPEVHPDTQSYLDISHKILTRFQFVDVHRTPGYPSFIAVIFLLFGDGNQFAVSAAQGVLFVVSILEIYALAFLALRRSWIAFLIGLSVASNVILIAYVKPVLSEGFTLWVVSSLALALGLCLRSLSARSLWLVAGWLLLAVMTRAEWMYAPALIFAFIIFVARRRGQLLRLLPHAALAIVCVYAGVGAYIYGNATQNNFLGMTWVENVNLLGKVMQYHMQNEAPPEYASVAHIVDGYVRRGIRDPYYMLQREPSLRNDNYALVGTYAKTIILQHPTEFVLDSIPVAGNSLTPYGFYLKPIDPTGSYSWLLDKLQILSQRMYSIYALFPLAALLWIVLLFWRRTASLVSTEIMAGVTLIALYDLIMTTLGGYSNYPRFHVPFDPLLTVVILGTVLVGLAAAISRLLHPGMQSAAQSMEVTSLQTTLSVHIPSTSQHIGAPPQGPSSAQPALGLSVVIPVYNEESSVVEVIRRVLAQPQVSEVLVVNDGSSDGTSAAVRSVAWPAHVRLLSHPVNQGKGAAVRMGIAGASQDVIIVQDADFEYDPADYPLVLKPILEGRADVVFGSRFLTPRPESFWLDLANRLLTLATNVLYGSRLTDMETCYKAFRADVLKSIHIRSNRFDFEPEITAKVLRKRCRIVEVPISYQRRGYESGKKIHLGDAFAALGALVRYRWRD